MAYFTALFPLSCAIRAYAPCVLLSAVRVMLYTRSRKHAFRPFPCVLSSDAQPERAYARAQNSAHVLFEPCQPTPALARDAPESRAVTLPSVLRPPGPRSD